MRSRYMGRLAVCCLLPLLGVTVVSEAKADQLVIDFESFPDSTTLANQIAGLTFSHGVVLTSTGSLFGGEFPPQSGVAAASDDSGPMSISFDLGELGASAVTQIGGYFTYSSPVTITAFGVGNVLLGSVQSTFSANYTSSGNPPNEFLEFSNPDIRSLTIAGDPAGFSFIVDDLSVNYTPALSTVPEPRDWALPLLCALALVLKRVGFLRDSVQRRVRG